MWIIRTTCKNDKEIKSFWLTLCVQFRLCVRAQFGLICTLGVSLHKLAVDNPFYFHHQKQWPSKNTAYDTTLVKLILKPLYCDISYYQRPFSHWHVDSEHFLLFSDLQCVNLFFSLLMCPFAFPLPKCPSVSLMVCSLAFLFLKYALLSRFWCVFSFLASELSFWFPCWRKLSLSHFLNLFSYLSLAVSFGFPTSDVAFCFLPQAKPDYSFSYGVEDPLTGNSQNHKETRDGDVVKGQYTVLDPDGTTRTVTYTADPQNGFQATVHHSAPSNHVQQQAPAPRGHYPGEYYY